MTPSNGDEPVVVGFFQETAGPKSSGLVLDEPLDGFSRMEGTLRIAFVAGGQPDYDGWLWIPGGWHYFWQSGVYQQRGQENRRVDEREITSER